MNSDALRQVYSAFSVAARAGCENVSPRLVRGALDEVAEAIETGWMKNDYYEEPSWEIAARLVPVHTEELFEEVAGLNAYRLEIDEFGPFENLEDAARVAVLLVYEALVNAAVEIALEEDKDRD